MRTIATSFSLALTAALLFPTLATAQPKPLASVETNWTGVTLDLMSVERKASVLTVKWTARNAAAEAKTVSFGLKGDQATTYLVDEESGTKYYALTDKEGNLVASESEWLGGAHGISESIPPGESRRLWAKFPAPPTAVKTLTVFFSNAEPLEEVPITDKWPWPGT